MGHLSRLARERSYGFTAVTPWGFSVRVSPETLAIYSRCCCAGLGAYDRRIYCCRRCGEPVPMLMAYFHSATVEGQHALLQTALTQLGKLSTLEAILAASEVEAELTELRREWWPEPAEDPYEASLRATLAALGS